MHLPSQRITNRQSLSRYETLAKLHPVTTKFSSAILYSAREVPYVTHWALQLILAPRLGSLEGDVDTDGDGILNASDTDDDGDGVPDQDDASFSSRPR